MNTTRLSMLRTRWAAIGAAVAVTLGGGGLGVTHALTSSGEKPIYKPLDSPCRLADLRSAPFTVGPRSAPLGPNETYILDGWGSEGNCNLPSNTAGIEVNVTAVDPTEPTFLRFWPGDGAQPETANLNPTPGQPPTPNSVTIGLSSADGTFKVFNRFGSVNIIIDVVGVYDDHNHDDRYYTEAEVDALVSALEAAQPFAVSAFEGTSTPLTSTATAYVSVTVTAPVAGHVTLNSTAVVMVADDDGDMICALAESTNIPSLTTFQESDQWFEKQGAADGGSVSGTRVFAIAAGATTDYVLACRMASSTGTIRARNITAIFTPAA